MRNLMMSLVASLSLLGGGAACSKDRTDADPCERAIDNAQRLANAETSARERFGGQPLTQESCRGASPAEIACAGYASDWSELQRCAPSLVR